MGERTSQVQSIVITCDGLSSEFQWDCKIPPYKNGYQNYSRNRPTIQPNVAVHVNNMMTQRPLIERIAR